MLHKEGLKTDLCPTKDMVGQKQSKWIQENYSKLGANKGIKMYIKKEIIIHFSCAIEYILYFILMYYSHYVFSCEFFLHRKSDPVCKMDTRAMSVPLCPPY